MSLKYAILAALLEGEASGYDLAKVFDVSVANFWSATPQQLYRELDRLAGEGLVAARVVQQERRPNKRIFRLTEAGRKELRTFTETPPRPTTIRDELLVKVQAVDQADPDTARTLVAERLEWARAKLAGYERLRDVLLDGRSEEQHLADADRIGPYLTLMRGRMFEQENVRWCERVLEIMERRGAARDGTGSGATRDSGAGQLP
ncbi:PadR family transcriptional regulator [Streptomyces sp. FIT100]|uniref:PadR family transcriptional regulator n=1 Tax=Streptomyces sp. FIT100 TaxID=2837956 RepID=UPI0021CA9B43|nr:PadR family transcriptional regulator [Streptomyces sp. FIT100]UUN27651.1 PadR family transcriptional regulator [Streptomyces sp. FIT100]